MDSITHVVLGAVIGEAAFRKSSAKHGMLVGAIAQSLPDIDFVAAAWLSPAENMLAHRGFTHSILFAVLASLAGGLLMQKIFSKIETPFHHWFFFLALQFFTHLSIDVMNVYGIGLLEPFDHTRSSLNILFVADPLFSIWPGIAALVLLVLKTGDRGRIFWVYFGLIPGFIYFSIAAISKMTVEGIVLRELGRQRISATSHISTPAPLNSFLWYVVAKTDEGFMVGYYSLFDESKTIDLKFIPGNETILDSFANSPDVFLLKRFAQKYYAISMKGDTIVFSDLRFGQIFGWSDPAAPFVFQYYVNYPDENLLALQRGRFAKWNLENVKVYIRRIRGNKEFVPPTPSSHSQNLVDCEFCDDHFCNENPQYNH